MHIRRWVARLCLLALGLTLLPMAALPVAAQKPLPHRTETTLLEQIILRDGYLEGIWFPWFNHDNLGHGLTSNEVMVEYVGRQWATVGLDDYGTDAVYREIYNLKALGFNLLGYEGSIYGEGVVFDATGDVLGIKEEYLYNVRRFLDICRRVDMPVLWTVCCHSTSVNDYYTNGKLAWDVLCRCYADPVVAEHYAQRFVKPLCEVLREYDDVVAMVAVTSEAENEINDSQIGNHFDQRELYGVSQDNMLYFINTVTEAVKEVFPAVPRTICCQLEDMSIYSHIDFDLLGDQNYNYIGRSDPIESFRTTVPMFVSEFGLGFEKNYDDDTFWKLQKNFRDNFRADGYQGWMMWCWSTDRDQPRSTFSWLQSLSSRRTDFRPAAYQLHDYVMDYRAAHRSEIVMVDTPVLFCNTGDGVVEWIAPRQEVTMDLLYSHDGGVNWHTELKNVPMADYVTGRKGTYISQTAPTPTTVYQVVVRDGQGTESCSLPSNMAADLSAFSRPYTGAVAPDYDKGPFPFAAGNVTVTDPLKLSAVGVVHNRPATEGDNLLHDGSFESGLGGFTTSSALQVQKDATAPEGDNTLYFNSSAVTQAQWHLQWVEVKPDTEYVFSVWLKGAHLSSANRGYATIGVVDSATNRYIPYGSNKPFYTQTKQIVPTAWDEEWHLRSVSFNSGARTQIGIALYGCATQMWVDGLALYENGKGVKYVGEQMGDYVGYKTFDPATDYDYCAPKDSVIKNSTVEDSSSHYWQSGGGFDSGFMSISASSYEYGVSLKYTASATPTGMQYIQWLEVKPHTWYTFSADVKVLQLGGGRMCLLDGKPRRCDEVVAVYFDWEEALNTWTTLRTHLYTGSYTRLGLAVVDGGGSALLDNLRLFEMSKGVAGDDVYTDPDGGTAPPPTVTVAPTPTTTLSAPSSSPTQGHSAVPAVPTAPTTGETTATDGDGGSSAGFPWLYVGVGAAVAVVALAVAAVLWWRKGKDPVP